MIDNVLIESKCMKYSLCVLVGFSEESYANKLSWQCTRDDKRKKIGYKYCVWLGNGGFSLE